MIENGLKDKGGGVMKRLTSSDIDYCERYCDMDKNRCSIYSSCIMRKSFQKLKEYEDLEEQGLLLRLPCKVGDTVYSIANDGKIYSVKATREVRIVDGVLHIICEICKYSDLVSYDDIGKTVFLTKSEAEQKLKEMESD